MKYTQFLIFEIGTGCNLGGQHARCPNRHPDRYRHVNATRPMTDELIVETAVRMYEEHGFRGLIGWHYYNEPLCNMSRMLHLMGAIRQRVPEARFVLWSNGTLLPMVQDGFELFEVAYLTDYGNLSKPRVSRLRQRGVRVEVCRWPLDDRLTVEAGPVRYEPCRRMFTELIFDYYGNVHLCCYDWRGLGSLGNLWINPLDELVGDWREIRRRIAGKAMASNAPSVCLRCAKRSTKLTQFDRRTAAETVDYLTAGPPAPPPKKIGVVFVHYRLPRRRLSEHLAWNAGVYGDERVHVYVVAESPMQLPSRITSVVMPAFELPLLNGRTVFSLAMTKNRGIDAAIRDGCELVIVTDTDIAFAPESWELMCGVRHGEAIVPYYRKAITYEGRSATDEIEPGMTGTIAMRAEDWRVRFDEAYKGYGGEDGRLYGDMQRQRLRLRREGYIWHIAHDPAATDQKYVPGHGRADCWNRESGFNPDNFSVNRRMGP